MSRSAVAPLAGAALVPFAIAGATKLPYKEVFALVKKLLVLYWSALASSRDRA